METCCYLRQFLAKPHPLVGRKGPVCPFVPQALKSNSMYLAVVTTVGRTPQAVIERTARAMLRRFDELEPRTGRAAAYKAVVMIFPQVPLSHAPRLIDGVQLALKPEFVARGLMIGEFHLRDAISATHFWTVTPRRGYDDAHSS